MRTLFPSLFLLLIVACSSDDGNPPTAPEAETFVFEDSFESGSNDLDDLFPADGSRWSKIQQDDPAGAPNEIGLVAAPVSDGSSALRVLAQPSGEILSKIDIEKGGFRAFSGNTARISADFYIATTDPIADLILLDLECCSCWDPAVGDNYGSENQCPGIRLMMSGGNDYLSIERGKISGNTLQQTGYRFPRNQWVRIEWITTLADDENGWNSLRIDGNEVISESGMNLPNPEVFRDFFAREGIDFTLQEPVFYERVQVGATANPSAGAVELFVDNFSIRIE